MSKVGVIGGGAAGCMAAITAAENGHEVTLLERNAKIGRKLMITGKGRCNVTNACSDIREFIDNVPENGRFLYGALSRFMTYDTMNFFEGLGVPLKVERGDRVFPVSDKSSDIVDALYAKLRRTGVNVIFGAHVTGVEAFPQESGSFLFRVSVENGRTPVFDKLILATGGASYKATGSTGDGYGFARSLGHTVTELSPSLVPFESEDPVCTRMQGLSLKNIAIAVFKPDSGKVLYRDFGEMLFTHFGVSGPVILSASSHIRRMDSPLILSIDLKPALTEEQLEARILRDFSGSPGKEFKNILASLLPAKMIPVMVDKSGIDPFKKVNQITREERQVLLHLLKNFQIELSGFRPLNEAIVTSGGVSVNEINPKTMESKLVPGLFFAGEMIDTDAYTGGFNLQIAFSTGYVAGLSV